MPAQIGDKFEWTCNMLQYDSGIHYGTRNAVMKDCGTRGGSR